MNKLKNKIVVVSIILGSFLSLGFADKYFELSKNLDIFATLFKELNTYYVDETQPGQLMKTAIDGMLTSLDPYTNYIPESQIEDFKFMTTGQYGGIGALIHKDSSYVVISEPYEGFPAFKSGLRAGDKVIEIDGQNVSEKSTSDISEFLKGQAGTEVKLKVLELKSGNEVQKSLIRENIKVDDVPYYGLLEEKIGYIKLISFTQTASKSFIDAFKDLKEQGMEQLIFDLRGNGGGLLIEAVNIVNAFIPKGKLVVETKGKLSEWDQTYIAANAPIDTEIPVVILVDQGSASASEIVAGALQDYDRALLIGSQTFGKGLVQQTRPLSYNAQLKVTVAKYYIPSGRCIQRIDYSNKTEEGEAKKVPDSLIQEFKTLVNKRDVFDGKGIKPDVSTDRENLSQIAATLLAKLLIFDYASNYYKKHDRIESPKKFELTDDEYANFISFLEDKDYSYETKSERLLESLKKTAEKEGYYKRIDEEYKNLQHKIDKEKEEDLEHFKDEIKQILENEIISRYYFQNGRIIQSLDDDLDVLEAKNVLKNNMKYNQLLSGTFSESKESN